MSCLVTDLSGAVLGNENTTASVLYRSASQGIPASTIRVANGSFLSFLTRLTYLELYLGCMPLDESTSWLTVPDGLTQVMAVE